MAKTRSRKDLKLLNGGMGGEKPPTGPPRSGLMREVGFSRYNRQVLDQEFLPELIGKSAIAVYREMRMNEPVIRGILFVIESLMRSRTWQVEPVNETPEALAAAEFVRECLDDMQRPLDGVLVDVQNAFVDGFAWCEIVWKRCKGASLDPRKHSRFDDGRLNVRKIVGRSPAHLEEFVTFEDSDDLKAAIFNLPPFNRGMTELKLHGKSFHFRPTAYLDDPYGMSLLRGAYKPYFYKKGFEGFEAIAVERDLAGFITLTAPEGIDLWNTEDPAMVTLNTRVNNFLMSVRNNEISGASIPFGWMLDVKKGGGDRQIEIENVINRLEHRMGTVVAGDFILLGQEQVGSKALAEVKWDTFCTAVMGFCTLFANEFRDQVLRYMMRYNGKPEELTPKLVPSEIKQGEFGQFASYINALGSGGFAWYRDKGLVKGVLDRAGLRAADLGELIDSTKQSMDAGVMLPGSPGAQKPEPASEPSSRRAKAAARKRPA